MLSVERQERMLNWLGLDNGKLSPLMVHLWEVGNDFSPLRELLNAVETANTLSDMSIHQVDGQQSHSPSSPVLMRIPRQGKPVLILIQRSSKAGRRPLKVNATTLGLGINGAEIFIPDALVEGASHDAGTDSLRGHIDKEIIKLIPGAKDSHQNETPGNAALADEILMEKEAIIASLRQDIHDLKRHEAGLRAIIRECLKELRQLNVDSPLLNDDVRQQIYNEYSQHETEKSESN